jgi:predicted aldo/keto reductase-like oxidoreductase
MRLPIREGNPEKIDEPLATRMLHQALDAGVNYLDTAYPYHGASATSGGQSELLVGEILSDGYRDQVYLSTKLPCWLVQEKEDLDTYLNEQLERLKTDRIDFYPLHGLNQKTWENLTSLDVQEFLDSALEDGRIGYAGFSFHDELDVFRTIVDAYPWSFVQIQYNYMDQDFQAGKEGLEYIKAQEMGSVIMEPLRGGCLTRNIPSEIHAIWDQAPTRRTLAEWGLRFLWNQEEVDLVLSGMSTMEQVEENLRIAEDGYANSLTSEELDIIQEVREAYQARMHVGCTACGYCMPCPEGVDIPLNLNLLNDVYIYQNLEKPRGNYSFLSAKNMSAAYCTLCGECEDKCTQKIHIREYLKEAAETLEK